MGSIGIKHPFFHGRFTAAPWLHLQVSSLEMEHLAGVGNQVEIHGHPVDFTELLCDELANWVTGYHSGNWLTMIYSAWVRVQTASEFHRKP